MIIGGANLEAIYKMADRTSVCDLCLAANPYDVRLISEKCFNQKDHRYAKKFVSVQWSNERQVLEHVEDTQSIRPIPRVRLRANCKFILCERGPRCRGDSCSYAHSREEQDDWNAQIQAESKIGDAISLGSLPKQKEYKFQDSDSIEWPTLLSQSPQHAGGANKPQAKKSWAQAAAKPMKTKPAAARHQPPNKQLISDPKRVYPHQQGSRHIAPLLSTPPSTYLKKTSSAGEIGSSQHLQQSPVSGYQPQNPAAQRKKQRSPVPKSFQTKQTRTLSESSKDQVQYGRVDLVPESESLFSSSINQPRSFQQDNIESQSVPARAEYHLPLASPEGQRYPYAQSQQSGIPSQAIAQSKPHVSVPTVDDLRQQQQQQQWTTQHHLHQSESSMGTQALNLSRSYPNIESQSVPARAEYHLPLALPEGQRYPYAQSQQTGIPSQAIAQSKTHVSVPTVDDLRQQQQQQQQQWTTQHHLHQSESSMGTQAPDRNRTYPDPSRRSDHPTFGGIPVYDRHQSESSMGTQAPNRNRSYPDPSRRSDYSHYGGIPAHVEHGLMQPQMPHQQQGLRQYNDRYRHTSQQHYPISQDFNVRVPQYAQTSYTQPQQQLQGHPRSRTQSYPNMSPAVHVGQPISDAFMASPLSLLLSPPDSRLLSDRGQQVQTSSEATDWPSMGLSPPTSPVSRVPVLGSQVTPPLHPPQPHAPSLPHSLNLPNSRHVVSVKVASRPTQPVKDVLYARLSVDNYKGKFLRLLDAEVKEHERILRNKCNGEYQLHLTQAGAKRPEWMRRDNELRHRRFGYLHGLSGDQIAYATQASQGWLFIYNQGRQICRADILPENYSHTEERLAIAFDIQGEQMLQSGFPESRTRGQTSFQVVVNFQLKHSYFRNLKNCVNRLTQPVINKIMPRPSSFTTDQVPILVNLEGYKKLCSPDQLNALETILSCPPSGPPNIIAGPFGTGKTRILAIASSCFFNEARIKGQPARVLVCTQQRESVDNFFEHYQNLMRNMETDLEIYVLRDRGLKYPNVKTVQEFQSYIKGRHFSIRSNYLIISTCLTAQHLTSFLDNQFFSHILIDEGAQMREPEAIAPLSLADPFRTKIVIAGDQHQVGPAMLVLGDEPLKYGLATSLLERLHSLYKRLRRESYISTLVTNYRSHHDIVELPSALFYETPLIAPKDRAPPPLHPNYRYPLHFICSSVDEAMCQFDANTNRNEANILLDEVNAFARNWPIGSWGPQDLSQTCLMSLARPQLTLANQLIYEKRLSSKLKAMKRLPTYDMQGREFRALFLSTSEPTAPNGSTKNPTKSLCDRYVFNTAITRAQSLVVAAGNPFLLLKVEQHMVERYGKKGKVWSSYLKRCLDHGSFVVHSSLKLTQDKVTSVLSKVRQLVLERTKNLEDESAHFEDAEVPAAEDFPPLSSSTFPSHRSQPLHTQYGSHSSAGDLIENEFSQLALKEVPQSCSQQERLLLSSLDRPHGTVQDQDDSPVFITSPSQLHYSTEAPQPSNEEHQFLHQVSPQYMQPAHAPMLHTTVSTDINLSSISPQAHIEQRWPTHQEFVSSSSVYHVSQLEATATHLSSQQQAMHASYAQANPLHGVKETSQTYTHLHFPGLDLPSYNPDQRQVNQPSYLPDAQQLVEHVVHSGQYSNQQDVLRSSPADSSIARQQQQLGSLGLEDVPDIQPLLVDDVPRPVVISIPHQIGNISAPDQFGGDEMRVSPDQSFSIQSLDTSVSQQMQHPVVRATQGIFSDDTERRTPSPPPNQDSDVERVSPSTSLRSNNKNVSVVIQKEPPSARGPAVVAISPPSRLEKEFEVKDQLGKGGFGVVFHVQSKLDQFEYALKLIRLPNVPKQQDKVMREVRALAQLDHMHIVRYHTSWKERAPDGWSEMKLWSTIQSSESLLSALVPVTTAGDSSPQNTPTSAYTPTTTTEPSGGAYFADPSDSVITFRASPHAVSAQSVGNSGHPLLPVESEREAKPLARVDNTQPPTCLFIQTELCQRDTLRNWLLNHCEEKSRTKKVALDYFEQILSALQYIHSQSFVHRDLKPSNIFFSRREGRLKIGDFGLVTTGVATRPEGVDGTQHGADDSHSRGSVRAGTFLYMSPEQISGVKCDAKADMFALGVIFFELHYPMKTDVQRYKVLTTLRSKLDFPPSFIERLPNEVTGIIRSLLASDPDKRPTADELSSQSSLKKLKKKVGKSKREYIPVW